MHVYVLTEGVLHFLTTRYGGKPLVCARCGKELKSGETIVFRRLKRHYHKQCWDDYFI